MTLTDVLPSLRRTLPDPLDVDRWPAFTHATVDDVIVAGVSMSRLVELCDTPCVHAVDGVIPGTGGRRSLVDGASVVCTTVLAVSTSADAPRTVIIDGCLDSVPALWAEARLIRRVSTMHRRPTRVLSRATMTAVVVDLPRVAAAGDLLAVPCAGTIALRDLAVSPASPEPRSVDDPARAARRTA